MKRLRAIALRFMPVGGSTSLQTSDTTKQTAAIRQAAEAYGQRGAFVTVGTGGSKVTPTFDGGSGTSTLAIAAIAGALVLILLFRKRKK